MTTRVSMSDALSNVEVLYELPLIDSQPSVEGANNAIVYEANFDTNFEDKTAYITGISKYIEEAVLHSNLSLLLEQGYQHAMTLYTWRCCSRAIPTVKSPEQPNRIEIYEKTVEALQPEVAKLMAIMHFSMTAIDTFCNQVRRLCHHEKRKEFVSEAYLLTLGEFINMFAVLDELKNMKSSVKNDYSAYRRAAQFLRVISDSTALTESQNLSMFLATNDKIRTMLKTSLAQIEGYEELLADVVNTSVHMFENKLYLLPSEKHMLVKVIGFSLFLIDSTACNINKLDGKKKINVSRIDKIFKTVEVVPLYGDMQIAPFNYIKKSPNFDPSKWPICNDTSTSSMQGSLLMQLPETREEHERFIADLARYTNEGAIQKVTKRTDQEMKYLYNMGLTGLQLLSKWTNSILELYCWKLLHPADYRKGTSKYEDDGEEYERATRYNYSSQEKFAMVEILSLIKGLQLQMNRLNETFYEAICSTTYIELQTFIQIHIRDMIKKVTQKKRDLTKSILIAVRDTCVDWFSGAGEAGSIEEALALGLKLSQNHGSKKDHSESNHIRFNKRCVGPSSTQLYMVRTMIESLLTDKSGYGKRTLRKDIDYNHLSMIEQFHKQSFFWDYLLNFDATLKQCGDLSQLWYREFYLELTMGRKIQFPIEMSMPWILADHILESTKQPMIEYVFYPMDLYNDAAMHALLVFRKQFLYDEIEAEVNLCFDQLVFKLSDKIFTHFKCLAACMLLDKRYRSECHMNGIKVVFPAANRYDSLLKQRHIQLLGRSIDLTFLLTQRLTLSFKKSLETAIQRFESVNITGVMELQCLLEVNRLTHELLSSYLILDSFESIISEVNHSVSSALGRITLHIFWELTYDFLPHYCYNGSTNRFVKTQQPHVNETRREKMIREIPDVQLYGTRELNQAYDIVNNLYRGFVGVQHFRTMTRLLGYQGIAVVIQEMLKVVKNLLDKTIREFVEKLRTCMPKQCKLPRSDYGSPAILQYYLHQLHEIIHYPALQDVFHCFRELGNAILFFLMIEQSLSQEEIKDLLQAAPFQNLIPRPYAKEGESLEAKIRRLEAKYAAMSLVNIIKKLGTEKQGKLVEEADLLTRERLCIGLTTFEVMLDRIRAFLLDDPVWTNNPSSAISSNISPLSNIDDTHDFHRIWSALQFVYCLPTRHENDMNVEQLYGEGLNFAGCTIIRLLNEHRKFETYDFTYHLFKINRSDQKEDEVKNVSLPTFTERIRKFQILNQQIFACLNKYLCHTTTDEIPVEQVKCLTPMTLQTIQSSIPIYQHNRLPGTTSEC
ncbi:unnamed protein product [Rotaria sordida]|uniref:Cytoplasmic FMR1-interacting protein n=1 Tax=Rotaria sordida TaxID=392033 RepID=A0A813QEX2_9BILA|nr:unnamed protein product [Rotaria sordida]CAF0834965.1 unnamed protein product [Rotaria sordida]CAF0835919.1 unnamed protein product [Rotaria sordida]